MNAERTRVKTTCAAFDRFVTAANFRPLALAWGQNDNTCAKRQPDVCLIALMGDGRQALSQPIGRGGAFWLISIGSTTTWHYHKEEE